LEHPTPPIKAYSYLRFSTPEQMRGDSFRRQSAMAEAYALQHGLQLDNTLTFHDLGVSAFRGKNLTADGQLGIFIQAVEEGIVPQGSYLLVESLDRISRQTARKALRALEDVVESGAVVVTLNDGRRYHKDNLDADPVALLLSILTFMRAHEESAMKASRLKAVWAEKRTQASKHKKPLTAICPAWLDLDHKTGEFLQNPDRVQVVRRIFDMALEGAGQGLIAQTLNREGVSPFGRGKHWHRTYVAKLLDNPAVQGVFIPHVEDQSNGKLVRKALEPISNYFPTIIDAETIERLQSMRAGSVQPRRGRHAAKPLNNILGGLGRCAICGSTMTMTNKGDGNKYFVCTRAKAGAGCTYKSLPYKRIEDCFLSTCSALLDTAPDASEQAKQMRQTLQMLEEHLDWVNKTVAGIMQAIETSTQKTTPATLIDRLAELEVERKKTLKIQREFVLRESTLERNALNHRMQSLRASLEEAEIDKAKINALLRQLFSAIEISQEQGILNFQWQHSPLKTPVHFTKGGIYSVGLPFRTPQMPEVAPLPTIPDVPAFNRSPRV
jgi:DNA invertase Pin-like site-specific DNA recombinase